MYSIMACRFSIWIFLSVALCQLNIIFSFGPSLRPNFFRVLINHSAFLLCSYRSHIFPRNCFVSLSPGWWYVLVCSFSTFFRCFKKSCFVWVVLSCLDISLVCLFFVSPFWLIFSNCIVCFTCCVVFLFQRLFHFFSSFSLIDADFLSMVPVKCQILVLNSVCFLLGNTDFITYWFRSCID